MDEPQQQPQQQPQQEILEWMMALKKKYEFDLLYEILKQHPGADISAIFPFPGSSATGHQEEYQDYQDCQEEDPLTNFLQSLENDPGAYTGDFQELPPEPEYEYMQQQEDTEVYNSPIYWSDWSDTE